MCTFIYDVATKIKTLRQYMVYCIYGIEVTLIIYDDNTLSNLVIFKNITEH